MKSFDLFFMVYFIKVNKCSTNPCRIYKPCMDQCWSKSYRYFFYYYLLIFLGVLFETISHWHARISIKKKDQRKTYWADTWWRWITLDNLNIPQDTYCFGRFYFIKLCQIFTTTITQSNVINYIIDVHVNGP